MVKLILCFMAFSSVTSVCPFAIYLSCNSSSSFRKQMSSLRAAIGVWIINYWTCSYSCCTWHMLSDSVSGLIYSSNHLKVVITVSGDDRDLLFWELHAQTASGQILLLQCRYHVCPTFTGTMSHGALIAWVRSLGLIVHGIMSKR